MDRIDNQAWEIIRKFTRALPLPVLDFINNQLLIARYAMHEQWKSDSSAAPRLWRGVDGDARVLAVVLSYVSPHIRCHITTTI